jgi:hypothetical protein
LLKPISCITASKAHLTRLGLQYFLSKAWEIEKTAAFERLLGLSVADWFGSTGASSAAHS